MSYERILLFTLSSEIVCSFRLEQPQRPETHLVLLGAFLFNMHDISIVIQNISLPQQAATQLTAFHIFAFISSNVTHHLFCVFPLTSAHMITMLQRETWDCGMTCKIAKLKDGLCPFLILEWWNIMNFIPLKKYWDLRENYFCAPDSVHFACDGLALLIHILSF